MIIKTELDFLSGNFLNLQSFNEKSFTKFYTYQNEEIFITPNFIVFYADN